MTKSSAHNIVKPIIGVSAGTIESESARFIIANLCDMGAYPVLLKNDDPTVAVNQLKQLNGIILAGNNHDINPEDYGDNIHHKTLNEDNVDHARKRGDYEYALLREATKQHIPTFGICGGMQRINVECDSIIDGNLIQDVGAHNQRHLARQSDGVEYTETIRADHPAHPIHVTANTKLADIVGHSGEFKENSFHHQTIDRLRSGFIASAINPQGHIEAIEPDPDGPYKDHPFLMGVQWHPEFRASPESVQVLNAFVDASAHHAEEQPKNIVAPHTIDQLTDRPEMREELEKGYNNLHDKLLKPKPETLGTYPAQESGTIGL